MSTLRELKHKGNRALVAKRYEEAVAAFRAATEMCPQMEEGYLGLSRVFERTHQHERIIDLLQPVVERLDTASLLKTLGSAHRVLANRGESAHVDAAIACYEKYLDKRKDAVVLYYLAELYREHKQEFRRAYDLLLQSWECDPGSRTVYLSALNCATRLGRLDEVSRLKEMWKQSRTKD
jgi:tetratricopeptide (TPR) repeat protein